MGPRSQSRAWPHPALMSCEPRAGFRVRTTFGTPSESEVRHATRRRQRTGLFFEVMSKRRNGFPSETCVKRGVRVVHGDKLLEEKLGRNDLCPCGSHRRFRNCCLPKGRF